MAKYRSKEDDVNRILISIFVMNLPESFSAKDLFHTSRFQRKPLNEMSTSAKTMGENNKGGDKSSRSFGGAMGNGNSYINVLKSSNGVGCLESHSPDIVLDDECVISKELSYSLMGRVKEFALLTNLKTGLLNKGFADLLVRYLGELWVLLEFSSSKTKEAFRVNVGVSSWLSEIKQASLDIIPDGRIVWVEVEGVPLKLWSMNTFRRIATKWEDLIDVDDIYESYFHSKRLCLYTKSSLNIYENFKIIFKGKVFWIRAKEESEEEEQSDVGSLEGDNKINEDDLCGDNMDMADFPKTIFDESNRQKKDVSQDPFGIYPMLNKKTNEKNDKDHSPKYPPGFTPNEETNVNSGIGDKSANYNADKGTIRGDGVFVNVNSKGDDVDSVSIGRFKKSEAPRSGGSFLCLMEEVVKVGQTMGYNMEGVDNRCNRKVAFDKLKEELRLVDEAIDKDKSSSPDGFTFDFYRQFWSTIDKDMYAAVNHFFINGDIPAGCNLSFIALIPKVSDANLVKDFRPISLIGSIYKIIAKILMNRLINVLGDIVSEVQSAFVAGRQILDDPFILNEVLHWCSKKKQKSLIFKVQAWQEVVEKVKTRLSKWKMKMLSIGGRLTLLKSVLGSIPIFHMSIFRVPSKVLQILESIRVRFFNRHEIGSKKVLWVKWNNVLTDKKHGGLGVSSLYALNRGLMIKWLWKFFVHKDSIWTKVIKAIHGVNGNVNSSWGKAGRSCWLAIVDEVWAFHKKGVYVFDFMNLKLGNGEMVKF
nr:nucleotide-binding alpha-beta plait domain-containing protein [Tanacetum cinerariifolium]